MILNSLVLHNVGTFAGKQTINLTPPSESKPIVLIGGLNGAGKTTILEAIQLALFGALAPTTGRRSGGYDKYLRGLIHRGVPATEGAAIELTFTAHQEGSEHTYWVRRSWKATGASIREILLVSVDGKHNKSLTSTWNEYVETFLPRGIAGLFFFDGEQIEALADLERSREVLGSALSALLGLDLVERLATDLSVLKRRHRGSQVPESLRQSVDEKKQLLTTCRQAEEAAAAAEAARLTELERCQKLFHEATEAYRTAGGDLLEQRDIAENHAATVRETLARCEEGIRHELAESAPLLQLGELLGQLRGQVRTEAEAHRNSVVVDAMAGRDENLKQELIRADVAQDVIDLVDAFLSSDVETRRSTSNTRQIASLADHNGLEALLTSTLPESRKRLQTTIDQRTHLKAEREQAERVLAAIPDPEAVAPFGRAREEARDALLRAEAALTVASEMLASARTDRTRASDAYEASLDKAAQAGLGAQDDLRLVEHADRVRATLDLLRLEATRRHLVRISEFILESLSMLFRKHNLVTGVEIDPDTYTVALTGADGQELPAKNLSAGERQLLAVALLWGLARAAGQPLPVVVDTPLGRLDGEHRAHLLDRYFPHASHQVVLLSTDTEIDEAAFRRIAPHVGRRYRLEFDQSSNATHVEDDYFWESA
ncbi:DNA sulfur modification protein DndD [Nocardioides sp. YIM 152588]|uniref:DNA sulfur modification protein DndD n=1 Tax=Nocardioides sp. YIM 152588 TaxID=3158259 RepID=UPI0032E45BAE